VELGIAGRAAVVTGASRGIGRAVAELLAEEGTRLVISARGSADLDAAVQELRTAGCDVAGVAGDVSDPATTAAIVDAAGGAVDILVNNAGGESGHLPIDQLTDDDWERIYRLNVVSAVRMAVATLPHMRHQGWGRIVNVSSYTARVPEPFCAPYSAAKAALVNFSRNLSRSYAAEGVCTNCVLPGLTETEGVLGGFQLAEAASGRSQDELVARMLQRAPIDAGRLGTSSEVAAAIVFLCSEPAAWITGAALAVDGGTVRTAI
jgi:NAD(P)-dependent dehydrogenase (short-subunit alcohol dehydrogenase family)